MRAPEHCWWVLGLGLGLVICMFKMVGNYLTEPARVRIGEMLGEMQYLHANITGDKFL